MQFRALIGTVVSNEKATVKFEELIYTTEHKDEIEMLKKAKGVTQYGVALVEEPKVEKVESKVEEPKVEKVESKVEEPKVETSETVEKANETIDLVAEYEKLSGKTVSPRYSKDEVRLKAKIAELSK